jgi:hypothetical protein
VPQTAKVVAAHRLLSRSPYWLLFAASGEALNTALEWSISLATKRGPWAQEKASSREKERGMFFLLRWGLDFLLASFELFIYMIFNFFSF